MSPMKHLVLDIGGVFYRGWPDEAFWERWTTRTGLDRATIEDVLSRSPEHRAAQVGRMSADDAFAAAGARLGLAGSVMRALADQVAADSFTAPIPIAGGGPIDLRAEVDYERLRFAYRLGEGGWTWVPQLFDASILSDEASAPAMPNFTGAFVGMACQDLAGTARPADFDWFEYRERDYVANVS
jgi:hypothetical protein